MSISCGVPRRRRRRSPPQSRRRRPQPGRLLLPPHRLPPQPRPLLPQMHRLLSHRPRRLPHLHRLPLQVHRFQRRVATRGVNPLQSRQWTVARRGRIAIPGLVAAHHPKVAAHPSKTIARALSRTLYQKGSAAIPAWRGRVSAASAVAPGAVVNTELLPPSRFCPASTEMKAWSRRRKRRMEHGSQPKWRATADEDGHYSFSLRRGAMVKCDSPPPISRTQPPAADATGHLIVSPFAAGQDVVADAGGPTAAADMQRRRDRERSPRPTLRVPHVFTSRACFYFAGLPSTPFPRRDRRS
jgi:hypothetical protein